MDVETKTSLDFCRRLLTVTWAEVKKEIPEARARDASVTGGGIGLGSHWFFQLPDRPYYGGGFSWSGRAENAYHAKANGWDEFLRQYRKE